jgi:hypothetical protein
MGKGVFSTDFQPVVACLDYLRRSGNAFVVSDARSVLGNAVNLRPCGMNEIIGFATG